MRETIFSLLFITFFIACDKNNDDTPPIALPELATVTTNPASDILTNSATLGGVVLDDGNSEILDRGVCWSLNANPTLEDEYLRADGSGLGLFYVNVLGLLPETTYNVRAFAINEAGIAFGENLSFTTESIDDPLPPTSPIEAEIPKKIITSRAELTAIVNDVEGTIRDKGFVLATFENPTLNDIIVNEGDTGVGQFVVTAKDLDLNTVYFVRPYVKIDNTIHYGNQVTFKTTGYFGPSGGYVVYDHGEMIDGWRYLEASPEILENKWGCEGTFISGTLPQVGKGKENSDLIINGCGQSDCAAKSCNNYVFGGFSDWFLPSTNELEVTLRALIDMDVLISYYPYWTSTQTNATMAFYVTPSSSGESTQTDKMDKDYSNFAIPLRRY